MLRVGIIGAGFMGRTHAAAYQKLPDVEVVAIADKDLERARKLAEDCDANFENNAHKVILDPTIDLIDVTLPTPLHPKFTILGLEAGKHVVVEKPMALSLDETDAMLSAANKSGKFLMVAQVLRFWPEYVKIREILVSGRLGKPVTAVAYRLSNPPQWADWFLDPIQSGGTVMDLAIHDLDMMNWLFSPPNRVYATGAGSRDGDWGHVLIQGNHGEVRTTVEASFMMPKDLPFAAGLRVLCEKGMIEYRFQAGGASIEQGEPVNTLVLHEPGAPNQNIIAEVGDAFEREIAYFVKCVVNNNPPEIVPAQQARLAVQTALCARESIISGMPVKLV